MVRIIQGNMDASGQRYGLVVSQFNSLVTERLQSGALDTLCRHGVSPETIDVVLVPGAYDIPLFAKKLAASGRYDAPHLSGCRHQGRDAAFRLYCRSHDPGD